MKNVGVRSTELRNGTGVLPASHFAFWSKPGYGDMRITVQPPDDLSQHPSPGVSHWRSKATFSIYRLCNKGLNSVPLIKQ
ncbi:MAG TPA: hypothetical protein VGL22_14915 [Terracidiphilus sp.]